ncbi:Uncharacterised protein [Chryseobacterium nakagawai]|nr:Uncharacterised protein [Chryseobacterium nakagawai]
MFTTCCDGKNQSGRIITVYLCEVTNTERKLVTVVTSTIMTFKGDKAKGR